MFFLKLFHIFIITLKEGLTFYDLLTGTRVTEHSKFWKPEKPVIHLHNIFNLLKQNK